jgi:SAM-dependent methyltransferase
MRSRHADRFNHDDDADRYDHVVQDERDLIRRGYAACLAAVAEDLRRAAHEGALVDLGAGTGNLALALPPDRPLVLVDVSGRMLALAQDKLAGRDVELVQDDVLAWATESGAPLGSVGSTFALHHLEADEKAALFEALSPRMEQGARLVIGDLGFQDPAARRAFLAGDSCPTDVREAVEDELFWDFSAAETQLRSLGWRVRRRAHGPLIGSLVAERR